MKLHIPLLLHGLLCQRRRDLHRGHCQREPTARVLDQENHQLTTGNQFIKFLFFLTTDLAFRRSAL